MSLFFMLHRWIPSEQSIIFFSHKKKEIFFFGTAWMDPETVMLSEITQTENDKHCMISLTCGTKRTKTRTIS